ncbi:MAG: transposase [Myxococcota bacterium]
MRSSSPSPHTSRSSDAGLLLLREVADRTALIRRFASCFRDHRRPERIEHKVDQLLGQRVFGQALGYEDLNDHDRLRDNALLALASDKEDLSGTLGNEPGPGPGRHDPHLPAQDARRGACERTARAHRAHDPPMGPPPSPTASQPRSQTLVRFAG